MSLARARAASSRAAAALALAGHPPDCCALPASPTCSAGTVGYRSSAYACKLQKEGWEARNLEGGCVRWAQKRFPLVARDAASGAVQPVKRVHVYGKSWALAPDDYEAVVFPNTFVATLRGLLPSWLGGHKK